jgi:acetyl-CoA carboxylase biotin carboxyl carrier protein
VSESNVSELEITEAEGKVRIVKSPAAPAHPHAQVHTSPATAPVVPIAVPVVSPLPPAAAEAPPTDHTIKSPMVGTFYRSSSPGAKPYVEVGDTIRAGETICIIEAMKILNEIECDKSGTVTQVLCENGQAVEYGQPLFSIA